MKIIKAILAVLVSILFLSGLWFYFEHSLPSENTVIQEFLEQNSDLTNAEIINVELAFEYVEQETLYYLIKLKEPHKSETKLYDFHIKQNQYFQWHWCDDQTERKCDSESD